MTYRALILTTVILGLCVPVAAHTQNFMPMSSEAAQPQLSPTPPMGAPPATMPAEQPVAASAYTQEQIDQMLAPIALYPDPLVAQILMASTYPLEIVEAQRWLQNRQNAALKGDQLQAALAQQPWDPSVKSLVAFPQVLNMMDSNLQWTEQMGDAFLANQAGVTSSIQNLRQRAQAAGNLKSTPQETVTEQQGAILIEPPAQQQVVYVPYYDPSVVYGAWPYPGYPPYYFPPPPGYVYYPGIIAFGFGIGVVDWLWGWDHWDWRHHRIDIDPHRWARIDPHREAPAGGVWAHNPADRHGVPYHSAAVRAQFGGPETQARTNFRGYFNQTGSAAAGRPNAAQYPGASHFEQRSSASPAVQSRDITPEVGTGARNFSSQSQRAPQPRAQPVSQQHNAPMFESFSRGQEVHMQSTRGASSRASMTPAHAAAPAGGGNHGGGNDSGRGGNHGGGGGNDSGHGRNR